MAGFNTAVTGLKAATTDLDVTGNNIANSSTIGFKSSRTEFGDIYATAVVGAGSSNVAGSGVIVSDIAQDFQAGTIEFTNNNLDLAINGSGFFQLDDGQGGVTYTRAGAFELDKDGFIVSKSGKRLQGYGLDGDGNRLPIGDLAVTQKESPPKATEEIDLSFNIDDRADATALVQPYDRDNPATFTYSTTVRSFDSLGNEHTIKFNMVEQPPIREVQTLNFATAGTPNLAGGTIVVSGQALDGTTLRSGVGLDPDGTLLADGEYHFPGDVVSMGVVASGAAGTDVTGTGLVINGITVPTVTFASPVTMLDPATDAAANNAAVASAVVANKDAYITAYNALADAADQPQLINIAVDPENPDTLFYQFDDTATVTEAGATLGAVTGTGGAAAGALAHHDFDAAVSSLLTADTRIRSVQIADDGQSLDIRFKASATDVDEIQVRDTAGNLLTDVSITSDTLAANETHTYAFNSGAFTSGTLTGSPTITIGGVSIALDTADTQDDVRDKIDANQAAILDANPDVASVQFNSDGELVVTYKPEAGNVPNDVLGIDFGTPSVMEVSTIDSGDKSYEGVYRMYAYLNGTETLDLGKAPDPGEPGGDSEPGPILVTFNPTNGLLSSVNGTNVPLGGVAPNISITGADPADPTTVIELDITNTTQFASASIVKAATQDGYTKGDLIGVTFAETGEMVASFSNGQTQNLGVVAFATFENQSGLQPAGDTEWIATLTSGDAILNPPGTGLNGSLRSAALEQSNVDLSSELVRLIEAQRNFQANSKTLETLNTVTQAILQI